MPAEKDPGMSPQAQGHDEDDAIWSPKDAIDIPSRSDALEAAIQRLKGIGHDVRSWVDEDPARRDAFRDAFELMDARISEYHEEIRRRDRELTNRAKQVLERGRLFSPRALRRSHPQLSRKKITGLCPIRLANSLDLKLSKRRAKWAERWSARFALIALHREEKWKQPITDKDAERMQRDWNSRLKSKRWIERTWFVEVLRPTDWKDLILPTSLDRVYLRRLPAPIKLTTFLYHLSGLADIGSSDPIVPEPTTLDHAEEQYQLAMTWHARFPVGPSDGTNPEPDPIILPPDLAEQMFRFVARVFARSGGESPIAVRNPVPKPDGWTKGELVSQANAMADGVSPATFDNIRRTAKVKPSPAGGKGQQRRFSRSELREMIHAVEAGRFRKRTQIANSWRELLDQ